MSVRFSFCIRRRGSKNALSSLGLLWMFYFVRCFCLDV